MKPLDQKRSIEASTLNHTAKVKNKFVSQDSILIRLMDFASSVSDFRRSVLSKKYVALDDYSFSLMMLS